MFPKLVEDAGYVLNKDREKQVGTVMGTSTHKSAQYILNNRKDTGKRGRVKDAQDINIATYEEEIKEGVKYDKTTQDLDIAQKQLLSMSYSYYHKIAPKIKPVEVEMSINSKYGSDYEITGHPDAIEKNRIQDLKTGKIKPDKYHAQMGQYSINARSNKIIEKAKLVIDHLKRPTKTAIKKDDIAPPERYLYDRETSEQLARDTVSQITQIHKKFVRDGNIHDINFNINSMLCHPAYCKIYGNLGCPATKFIRRPNEWWK